MKGYEHRECDSCFTEIGFNEKALNDGGKWFCMECCFEDGEEYATTLKEFAEKLLNNIVDTEPEIAQITPEQFLEMYEDF
jgi:hypothetical protein